MNYLAHAYLSFNEPQILVGNMISDFVKGNRKFGYPVTVQLGIQLHRNIDAFTDTHPATARAKEIFRPHYRLYSGAIVDILYDYFLANDSNEFSDDALRAFAADVYVQLEDQEEVLPERFGRMLPYMKKDNWPYHYKTRQGIGKSLAGLVRRAAYLSESDTAVALLIAHEEALRDCYAEFFPAVKLMAKARLQQLLA